MEGECRVRLEEGVHGGLREEKRGWVEVVVVEGE